MWSAFWLAIKSHSFIITLALITKNQCCPHAEKRNDNINPCANFISIYKHCKCKLVRTGVTIDCSNAHLIAVPHFPKTSVAINLKGNALETVSAYAFHNLPLLQRLDLRSCRISRIQEDAFAGLNRLIELNLAANSIKRLPNLLFSHIPNLYTLDLSGNCDVLNWQNIAAFKHLKKLNSLRVNKVCANTIADDMFSNCSSLHNIELNFNHLKHIPKACMFGITNIKIQNNLLSSLALHGKLKKGKFVLDASNNKIRYIGENDLQGYSNIYRLTLKVRSNDILDVHPTAFRYIRHIYDLEFFGNPLGGNTSHLLQSLNGSTIMNLHLGQLGMKVMDLTKHFFEPLMNTKVSLLNLRHNAFITIHDDAFQFLPYLTNLNLMNCKINIMKPKAFRSLKQLTMLDISKNYIKTINFNGILKACSHLKTLLAKSTGISMKETWNFTSHKYLERLDLSENSIVGILDFRKLTHLRSLHLNQINGKPSSTMFNLVNIKIANLTNLTVFSFSRNRAYIFMKTSSKAGGIFEGLINLKELDLSKNELNKNLPLPNNLTRPLISLKRFDLKESFGSSTSMVIGPELLEGLEQLEYIGLARNSISTIGPNSFKDLYSLKVLDLSNNRITTLRKEHFSGLRKLEKLMLKENAFACTCDLRWFVHYVKTHKKTVIAWKSLTCSSPPAYEHTKLIDYEEPWIACDNHFDYILGATITVFLLIMISSILLLYFRWDIKYFYLAMKMRRRRVLRKMTGYTPVNSEEYDVFVCYQEANRAWIMQV